jgi:hypothetical protein
MKRLTLSFTLLISVVICTNPVFAHHPDIPPGINNAITAGAGASTAIAALAPPSAPVAGGTQIGLLLGSAICNVCHTSDEYVDPDDNYTQPVVLAKTFFRHYPGSGKLYDDINESLTRLANIIDTWRMYWYSLKKYVGAKNDKNQQFESYHQKNVLEAISLLKGYWEDYKEILEAVHQDVQGTPTAAITLSVDDVLEQRDLLLKWGFSEAPDVENDLLDDMNATSEEKDKMIAAMSFLSPHSINSSLLSGATIYNTIAGYIGDFDVAWLLPSDISENLLMNGSFEQGKKRPKYWKGNALGVLDFKSCSQSPKPDGSCIFTFTADQPFNKYLVQGVPISGQAGEKFTLMGWSKAAGALSPTKLNSVKYSIEAKVYHTDGTKRKYSVRFSGGTYDWKKNKTTFTTKKPYNKMKVYVRYGGQRGIAHFDDVQLLVN